MNGAVIVLADYRGLEVSFTGEGWFNATQAAAKFSKRPVDWLKSTEAKRYMRALARSTKVTKSHFARTQRGGREAGTWLHPKLAVRFAQWLDVDFAVWCDEQIDALLHGRPMAIGAGLYAQRLAFEARKAGSEQKGKIGSRLMNERRNEKPVLLGEPWFVAMDIADILGYSDAYEMTKRLDDDEKSNRQIAGSGPATGGRGVIVINESGLYSAILGSQKDEAKRFKKWVTSEVLPSIRKTGSYTAQTLPTAVPASKEFRAVFGVLRLIGCDRQAAAIGANHATAKLTGTNLLELSGHTHLEAANQESLFFTPTELGKRIGLSAVPDDLRSAGDDVAQVRAQRRQRKRQFQPLMGRRTLMILHGLPPGRHYRDRV